MTFSKENLWFMLVKRCGETCFKAAFFTATPTRHHHETRTASPKIDINHIVSEPQYNVSAFPILGGLTFTGLYL